MGPVLSVLGSEQAVALGIFWGVRIEIGIPDAQETSSGVSALERGTRWGVSTSGRSNRLEIARLRFVKRAMFDAQPSKQVYASQSRL
jgi:hypothetical protein